jgi:hypothetical protein
MVFCVVGMGPLAAAYVFSLPPYQGGIEGGWGRMKNLPQPLLIKEGSYADAHRDEGADARH